MCVCVCVCDSKCMVVYVHECLCGCLCVYGAFGFIRVIHTLTIITLLPLIPSLLFSSRLLSSHHFSSLLFTSHQSAGEETADPTPHTAHGLKGVEALILDYHVGWPVSLVLSRRAITKYQLLSRLLYFR